MNKKGFTLIELTISIALLSLIMAFLFNFLITIRKNEEINNYVLPLIKRARKDEYLINKRYEDDMINKINNYYKKGFRK